VIFEGAEKEVKLVVNPSFPSLRSIRKEQWIKVVASSGARIISKISNSFCDAYLLSESSLFIYDHKIITVTCGQTNLVAGLFELLNFIPPEQIEVLLYIRKAEVLRQNQITMFQDDVKVLNERISGKAFQMGDIDEDHICLFHLDRFQNKNLEDMTLDLQMYEIEESTRNIFFLKNQREINQVLDNTGIREILPGFQIDDHIFNPAGYSLNAIRDHQYYTLHVTLDKIGSYVSFKSNFSINGDTTGLIQRVLNVFRPKSFSLVLFNYQGETNFLEEDNELKKDIVQNLSCGYRVHFKSFIATQMKQSE